MTTTPGVTRRTTAPSRMQAAATAMRRPRCSPNSTAATRMVSGASRLSSSEPAAPLTRESPSISNKGPATPPSAITPSRGGTSARVRGASRVPGDTTRYSVRPSPAPR